MTSISTKPRTAGGWEQRDSQGTQIFFCGYRGANGMHCICSWVQTVLQLGRGDYCSRSWIASLHCFVWHPGPDLRGFCHFIFKAPVMTFWAVCCEDIFASHNFPFSLIFMNFSLSFLLSCKTHMWSWHRIITEEFQLFSFHHSRMFFNLIHSITS